MDLKDEFEYGDILESVPDEYKEEMLREFKEVDKLEGIDLSSVLDSDDDEPVVEKPICWPPEDKEPVIDELELPAGHPLHEVANFKEKAITVLYTCRCGYFGYILSDTEQCPKCKNKIKFDGKRLVLD
jgi:hypothetical protein